MNINEMQKKIEEFEKKRGWDKTGMEKIVEFLEEDMELLKDNVGDKAGVDEKTIDIFVQLLQIARRNGTNLESLFKEHLFEMEEKYPVKENGSD